GAQPRFVGDAFLVEREHVGAACEGVDQAEGEIVAIAGEQVREPACLRFGRVRWVDGPGRIDQQGRVGQAVDQAGTEVGMTADPVGDRLQPMAVGVCLRGGRVDAPAAAAGLAARWRGHAAGLRVGTQRAHCPPPADSDSFPRSRKLGLFASWAISSRSSRITPSSSEEALPSASRRKRSTRTEATPATAWAVATTLLRWTGSRKLKRSGWNRPRLPSGCWRALSARSTAASTSLRK